MKIYDGTLILWACHSLPRCVHTLLLSADSCLAGVVVPDDEGVISDGEDVGMVNVDGPCSTVTFSCCLTFSTDFMGVVDFLSLLPELLIPLLVFVGGVGGVD